MVRTMKQKVKAQVNIKLVMDSNGGCLSYHWRGNRTTSTMKIQERIMSKARE